MGIFETFGKYRLAERLATGGMAEVYLGTLHGAAGFVKPVVIKRLHPRLNEDADFVQMLIDEARITSQLIHGNICQVLDLGAVDGAYYIAMEFISGEDLRTVQDVCRKNRQPLPVEAAIYIVSEILSGLDYAHRKEGPDGRPLGIIHRDISPQNILVSYEGEVKIIDFGIAKARLRLVQTQAGVIKGKFRYMAPEQASGEPLDQRTDVFAAGVVLYELLSGGPHSLELSDTEVLRKMRRAEFEPLRRLQPDFSPELETIVTRSLQRRPRDRYASAASFRNRLLGFLQRSRITFGRSELCALMRHNFDEDRRRRRSGSFSGRAPLPLAEDVTANAPALRASSPPLSARRTELMEDGAPTMEDPGGAPGAVTDDDPPTHELQARRATIGRGGSGDSPNAHGARAERQAAPRRSLEGRTDADDRAEPPLVLPDPERTWAFSGSRPEPPRDSPSAPGRSGPDPLPDPADTLRERTRQPSGHQSPGRAPAPGEQAAAPPAAPLPPLVLPDRRAATGERGSRWRALRLTLLAVGLALVLGAAAVLALHLTHPAAVDKPHDAGVARPGAAARDGAAVDSGATVQVRVRSRPPGAAIRYCGRATGLVTPSSFPAQPGRRCLLELEPADHDRYRLEVTPTSSGGLVVATLRRGGGAPRARGRAEPVASPTSSTGLLRVTSIQVGTVYLNGKAAGQTPQLELKLRPGAYSVRVHFPALDVQSRARTVRVQAGRTTLVHLDPQP